MSFVSSRRHIVGSLLALAGLAVYLLGIAHRYWGAVAIALYVIGYFATPQPARLAASSPPRSPEAIAKFLESLVERLRGEVEPSILARVQSIVSSINNVLPVLSRGTMQMDGTSYAVRQIATEFLPSALDAYLKISRRDRMRRRDGHRTPHEVLQEQLGVLDAKMRDVVLSVQRNDLLSVFDSGRFLKSRFSTPTSADAVRQHSTAP